MVVICLFFVQIFFSHCFCSRVSWSVRALAMRKPHATINAHFLVVFIFKLFVYLHEKSVCGFKPVIEFALEIIGKNVCISAFLIETFDRHDASEKKDSQTDCLGFFLSELPNSSLLYRCFNIFFIDCLSTNKQMKLKLNSFWPDDSQGRDNLNTLLFLLMDFVNLVSKYIYNKMIPLSEWFL